MRGLLTLMPSLAGITAMAAPDHPGEGARHDSWIAGSVMGSAASWVPLGGQKNKMTSAGRVEELGRFVV